MMDWQPIETAPLNGDVLVYVPRRLGAIVAMAKKRNRSAMVGQEYWGCETNALDATSQASGATMIRPKPTTPAITRAHKEAIVTNTTDEWLWTDWHGGECPLADESWRPRFRDGGTALSPTNPSVYRWEHWGTEADIIAYAVRNPDYVAPAPADFGPWIEWKGGACPIPDVRAFEWEYRLGGEMVLSGAGDPRSRDYKPFWESNNISAYRIRLPAPVDHMALLRQCGEALEPFASKAELYPSNSIILVHDDVELWQTARNKGLSLEELGWTVGDLRKALAALEALRKAGVM